MAEAGTSALILGARALVEHPSLPETLAYVTGFRPDYDALAAAGAEVHATLPAGTTWQVAFVCLPRNRVQGMSWIAQALRVLAPGGWLLIDGQKTDGIEAALKALGKVLPLEGILSKAHGKIAWVRRPDNLPEALDTWVAAAALRTLPDGHQTAPGMFSADGLDPATAQLIEHLPADYEGIAADLGAGWGALSAAMLARAPKMEAIDLIEADHASIEAARLNVSDPRARFHWADARSFTGGPYKLVISNPPFHTGRAADPDLGRAFIAAAARLMHPKGTFLMVANRQLPYEQEFESLFHSWSHIATDSRFKVFRARHPRRANKKR